MGPAEDRQGGTGASDAASAARLSLLERQVAALAAEVAELRAAAQPPRAAPRLTAELSAALRRPPKSGGALRSSRSYATISGEEIESLVGRYGTLLLAALVILMGVGVLIQVAVSRGLLTPAVRIGFGALAAGVVGAAGVYFHRKGEVRYGNVLLALTLAMVDLVAWGAGPRLHLVSTPVALAIVDLVAIALATLALHDGSEFLFTVAAAGALSSPFVTADVPGSASMLLTYGAVVLIGAQRAVREPAWWRSFAVMVGGALFYALAAAGLPAARGWYAPYLLMLFSGALGLGALLLADPAWRGRLSRAYVAIGLVGVPVGWDPMLVAPAGTTLMVAAGFALVTYGALAVRGDGEELWLPSALVLPLVSLAVASTAASGDHGRAAALAVWSVLALAAWRLERARGETSRGGAHLLVGGVLGTAAVAMLLWPSPLPLVAGLAVWGVLLCVTARNETSLLPLIAVATALGAAATSAIDQLASRQAYAYVPFTTRSSASALCATLGLALGSALLARGRGRGAAWADRPVRLAVVIGFAILWGRMELAQAFNRDVATFLLTAYYAGCGVGSIVVGRQLGIQRLRLAGLTLAIYAAVKAVVGASEIGGVMLRVGAYGAVGLFLLGAGYLYRERRETGEKA